MVFLCDICKTEFTLKHNLTRHMKNQHGNLWSCGRCNKTFNRCDTYEYHQRTCLFKTTGQRSNDDGEGSSSTKRFKDRVNHVGGALNDTLVDYLLDLEDEPQDAGNILQVLKDSFFQLSNKIDEELRKKRAIKVYVAPHAHFHLGSDETFMTDPPALFKTDSLEIYESTHIDDVLNNTYENLVKTLNIEVLDGY